jgi:hypothetical protein
MEDTARSSLSSFLRNLTMPAMLSSLVVLPFMILELMNRQSLPEEFPVVLFGVMWLLAFAFIAIMLPIVRELRAADRRTISPLRLLPRVLFLVAIAWFWAGLVYDQMPCFLGVPNCD